jgi:hypothetical protein
MVRRFDTRSLVMTAAAAPRATRRKTLVASLSLALAFGCGDEDRTRVDDPAGAAGQVGGGGTGGASGAGGSAGAAGAAGTGNEPSACLPGDAAFTWPGVESVDVPANAEWKPQLELPYDPFLSTPQGDPSGEVLWVKFIVLLNDPSKVYFHNATTQPFHYEFASRFIPEFQGMTRARFDEITLQNAGRQAILGAVVAPSNGEVYPEYGVQLVSNDDLHPELVESIVKTVAANVTAPSGTSAFYVPSGTSAECIESKRDDLAARGVAVGSVDRWLVGDACYAPGWAVGKLVALPAAEVDAAYLDGRLTPDDILLLTDTPPAELPFVAGVLTLAPSTPNAHTAILARSYGVPFAYVRDADALAAAAALTGKTVVLSTSAAAGRDPFDLYFGGCDLRFIDVNDLSSAELAEIRALSAPPVLEVPAKQASGVLTLPSDGLVPADITRVGGKAANFGLLRAAVPNLTPTPALALTFDLWDAFMAQPAPGGTTSLRDEIATRLAPHTWPADLRALDVTLEAIRDLIEDAPFPEELQTSLVGALGGFDPETRIRFRSSTNVEDSETFTGAGLYDSATGCLADDLDSDGFGPSLCNPAELDERGVWRAIQRVYASFYFRNAYFERLRRGVNEAEVGMGVLVHYSVPDPDELANGVATLDVQEEGNSTASLVSQQGAVSVTNPEGSALPEQVLVYRSKDNPDYVATQTTSSLLPLGAHVLEHEADYLDLMQLFSQVSDRYAEVTGRTPPYALDFEYKKVAPGVLSLRQVRPLPLPDTTRDVTPFFVGSTQSLCQYGSEVVDGFAAHRLKARFAVAGESARLTPERLATRLYASLDVEYAPAGAPLTLQGDPSSFEGATHSVESADDEATVIDAWTSSGSSFSLRTRLSARTARNENPVVTPADFFYTIAASWAAPVPYLEYSPEDNALAPATRSEEVAELWGYCPDSITVTPDFPRIEASFSGPNGVNIQTSYWYPPNPRGVTAGYTAPAIKWDKTTIVGLTTAPIELSGYYSQTYAPKHHNFAGDYVFDPRLEPGLSEATRAELVAADIAYVVVIDPDGTAEPAGDTFWVVGLDGALRRL